MGRRRAAKDCTLEEYDAWGAGSTKTQALADAADSLGGTGRIEGALITR